MHHKVESAIGCACHPAALDNFDRISTAACRKMKVALTPALKDVAISCIQAIKVFIDRVAAEVTAAEAFPNCKVTFKRRKSP